ncbi:MULTISPECIES: ACT domain-containing protein [unclassified Rhizobium]|uniref:ACT domain-containing protein n=1 Tax=unclassified Rhizobium TaxID=2613769 RepID=UPI001ADB9A7A|nr:MULTISPECIES: ACT domain-containing protein [unclassified Rhizobium]MBO9124314.1 ACT domain-containing protein [Rhizobium sp. 16-488-2b]MBO9174846.1 ACT domain-containing protein [Rhizobium sp. 16-488-2a]
MTIEPVRDTKAMLRGMTPSLDAKDYVFCTTEDEQLAVQAAPLSLGWFREAEGVSLILLAGDAQRLGFDTALIMRRITLTVFSSLEGVGLTAAVATALANHNISCNMVAAYHHDHVFVPTANAEEAMRVLLELQAAAD